MLRMTEAVELATTFSAFFLSPCPLICPVATCLITLVATFIGFNPPSLHELLTTILRGGSRLHDSADP